MSEEHDGTIAAKSQHGYRMLRENNLAAAEEAFTTVLDLDPGNCYALVGLGDVARKRGDFAAAVVHYERCLQDDPDNTYALFGLADSYKSLKQYTRSVDAWERYLSNDDTNVTVLTRVAAVYRKVGNRDRSFELYARVLDIDKDNPYALIGLAHLHYDFREYDDALRCWTRMYEIDGENVDIRVLTSIGNCYRKLKHFGEGIPLFRKALEREPGNFYGLFGLADCYRGLNEPEQSVLYWNQILDNDPTNKVILTRAGDAYRAMGDYDRAEACYEKALSIEYDVYALLGLALINRRKGQPEAAVKSLETLRQREPRNPRVHQELAQALIQIGHREEALTVLREFRKTGIHNAFIDDLIAGLQPPG